jgi:hypothetical protein
MAQSITPAFPLSLRALQGWISGLCGPSPRWGKLQIGGEKHRLPPQPSPSRGRSLKCWRVSVHEGWQVNQA